MYDPVRTVEEIKLFNELLPQFTSKRKPDFIAMAAEWNRHLIRTLEANPASSKHIYLKRHNHLQDFAKNLTASMHRYQLWHRRCSRSILPAAPK